MKPKLLNKKLSLKKETVSHLDGSSQRKVLAGAVGTGGGTVTLPTYWKTCRTNCSCLPTCDDYATCCGSQDLCSC